MMDLAVAWCCIRTASMMDLAERGCPALGSSSVRRALSSSRTGLVPQTISHAPLSASTSVPGPHVSGGGGDVGGDGGDVGGGGEGGGGGESDGGLGEGVGTAQIS